MDIKTKEKVADEIENESKENKLEIKSLANNCPDIKNLHQMARENSFQGSEIEILNDLCEVFQPKRLLLSQQTILNDLNDDVKKTKLQWDIKPFGSLVMGTLLRKRNMDFYICLRDDDEVDYQDAYEKLEKIFKQSQHFSQTKTILEAKIPIIKTTHKRTKHGLNISVSSLISVHKTKFLTKLIEMDPRIRVLILIIKIWAKYWQINNTDDGITNYSLILLIIMYLQTEKIPILPSIKQLQSNQEIYLVDGVNFTFNKYYDNKSSRNEEGVKDLLTGFFKYYMSFDYSSFIISPYLGMKIKRDDFQKNKIKIPEYDRIMKYIDTHDMLKDMEHDGLKNEPFVLDSFMVIQDPFCLNSNTTALVCEKTFRLFKIHLTNAYKICTEMIFPTKEKLAELLLRIFCDEPKYLISIPVQECEKKQSKRAKKPEKENIATTIATTDTVTVASFSFNTATTSTNTLATIPEFAAQNILLPALRKPPPKPKSFKNNYKIFKMNLIGSETYHMRIYLRKKLPNKLFNRYYLKQCWAIKMIEFTKNMLEDVYKVQIIDSDANYNFLNASHKLNNDINPGTSNASGDYDFDNPDNLERFTMAYEFKANIDMWSSRDDEFKSFSTYLDQQLEITEKLQSIRTRRNYPGKLHCKLFLMSESNFGTMSFTLKNLKLNSSRKEKFQIGFEKFHLDFSTKARAMYTCYFKKLTKLEN